MRVRRQADAASALATLGASRPTPSTTDSGWAMASRDLRSASTPHSRAAPAPMIIKADASRSPMKTLCADFAINAPKIAGDAAARPVPAAYRPYAWPLRHVRSLRGSQTGAIGTRRRGPLVKVLAATDDIGIPALRDL